MPLSCLVFRGELRDDDSYSVRIQVLTPMVFKAPDNFDLASSWYQIYQTILCSLLNQLPWFSRLLRSNCSGCRSLCHEQILIPCLSKCIFILYFLIIQTPLLLNIGSGKECDEINVSCEEHKMEDQNCPLSDIKQINPFTQLHLNLLEDSWLHFSFFSSCCQVKPMNYFQYTTLRLPNNTVIHHQWLIGQALSHHDIAIATHILDHICPQTESILASYFCIYWYD